MIKINCDLCGKTEERLNRAIIEDVELNVCSTCSKFGKVLAPKNVTLKETIKRVEPKEEKFEALIENYSDIIKRKREAIGLTQKDFANKINEKEITIHKIETGTLTPPLSLARKLEKILSIKLIEECLEKQEAFKRTKTEGFTLGDFIKIKK